MSLLTKVQGHGLTFTLCADKPRLDLKDQEELSPLSCSADDRPSGSLPWNEKVISTDQVQSGSMAHSYSSTEAFEWPDVQHLRSKYGGGQRRVLSRARSMPERLLVRRHSSCSCLVLPEGPRLKVPSSESGDGRDADAKESRRRLQRTASLDLQLKRKSRAEAAEQLASLGWGSYFVAATTPLADDPEHSVIILEKVQEPGDTEGEENYIQIRSPTSKEKISLMAVMDRCRVYQDSEENREEAKVQRDARTPEEEFRRGRSRPESSRQGRVKNLRAKFQNMS